MAVVETEALLQKADRWARHALFGVGVVPRPDEALGRPAIALEEAQDRIAVGVRPTAHHVHRTGDGREILVDRALLPELVAALVGDPRLDERRRALHAVEPHVPPRLADDGRVRWAGVVGQHDRGPREHVRRQQAAAHVVDVVEITVVGRADAHDGAELGRAMGGDLQAVEAAPGDADHPHLARAEVLRGKPLDDLDAVGLLEGEVLVLQDAVGVARTAQVDPRRNVAVAGEVGVHRLVVHRGVVVLAVRDVLEDGRYRVGLARPRGSRASPPVGIRPASGSRRARRRAPCEESR